MEWPSEEEFFRYMDRQECPWCGAGPFKYVACHTASKHGATAPKMSEHYGLPADYVYQAMPSYDRYTDETLPGSDPYEQRRSREDHISCAKSREQAKRDMEERELKRCAMWKAFLA